MCERKGINKILYKKLARKIKKSLTKGSLRKATIPTKPRFRSVPDVAVLNSLNPEGSLIKCRRLPRGFLWNTSLPPLFIGYFTFGKANVMITYGISGRRYAEITFKKAVFLWDLEFRN
mgnify:CR=1 FL=1